MCDTKDDDDDDDDDDYDINNKHGNNIKEYHLQ